MHTNLIAAVLCAGLLSSAHAEVSVYKCKDIPNKMVREACFAERARKGAVPDVADPSNIVVAGQPMTQQAFLKRYCMGKTFDETCVKVSRQMSIESAKSKTGIPRF